MTRKKKKKINFFVLCRVVSGVHEINKKNPQSIKTLVVKLSSSQRHCFSLSHSPTRQKRWQKDFFFFSFAAMFVAKEQ
jgi:hypothetical protein